MIAQRKNLINNDRAKLQDVLPLDTPYSIIIDPCNQCNFKCKFCALHSSDEKQTFTKQQMPLKLFQKIIDDISSFKDKIKLLSLVGVGEPLLNRDFVKMVSYAKEKNIAETISTVTNGSLLNPDLNSALVESGIDTILISVEALDEKGYECISRVKINYQQFLENIKDLYYKSRGKCKICIKTVNTSVATEQEKTQFYEKFEHICDQVYIDHIIPLWSGFDVYKSFSDDGKGMHGQDLRKIKVCTFPFYKIMVNADGVVTPCCADWQRKLVVGNVADESLYEIWHGNALRKFWIDLLSHRSDCYEMCRTCQLPQYDGCDNIDAYTEEILKKLL